MSISPNTLSGNIEYLSWQLVGAFQASENIVSAPLPATASFSTLSITTVSGVAAPATFTLRMLWFGGAIIQSEGFTLQPGQSAVNFTIETFNAQVGMYFALIAPPSPDIQLTDLNVILST